MTLEICERITIQELITGLSHLSFDEVTHDKLIEIFPNSYVEFVNDINAGMGFRENDSKDISIDDYVFTVRRVLTEEGCGSGFKVNDSIFLSNYVEVWLKPDSIGSNDIQAEGTIKRQDKSFYLEVNYTVD